MPETRTDRTAYLGLLALMLAAHDTQDWSYPYWNPVQIDAALAALADAVRDGTANPAAPDVAPTLALLTSGGYLPGGQDLEVVQTFVDAYGRETAAGTVGTISTGEAIPDPDTAPTLAAPTEEASGYAGGELAVCFSWTDGNGGETLASPIASVNLPYLSGLYSQVVVTLPSTPAAVGAAGANVYVQHRGGNVVLAKHIVVDTQDDVTLDGTTADCYLSIPYVNSTGSTRAIQITGHAGHTLATKTRFYIRLAGGSWTDADHRLKAGGVDEWTLPATYPLVYTGASGSLAPGYPPTTSQVKAIRPTDLTTEAIGTLPAALLPDEAVLETELVKSNGEALVSGFGATPNAPGDMKVDVAAGIALLTAGRFAPTGIELTIPTADPTNDRIDIICLADDGVIEGPTENAALKGAASATPAVPATPGGYIKLAEIYVTAADTQITSPDITDCRVLLTTLVAETVARIAGDASIAGDLSTHTGDAVAHASKAHTIADAELTCGGSSTANFTITAPGPMLVTALKSTVTSAGAIDYMIQLYSNAGRSVLEYQAGDDADNGIDASPFEDRIPWEWFGGTTIYGTITNNSADDLTAIAIGVKYRL